MLMMSTIFSSHEGRSALAAPAVDDVNAEIGFMILFIFSFHEVLMMLLRHADLCSLFAQNQIFAASKVIKCRNPIQLADSS